MLASKISIVDYLNAVKQIVKRVAHGDVPSTDNGRGSHIKSNSSGEIVAEKSAGVKEQYSVIAPYGYQQQR